MQFNGLIPLIPLLCLNHYTGGCIRVSLSDMPLGITQQNPVSLTFTFGHQLFVKLLKSFEADTVPFIFVSVPLITSLHLSLWFPPSLYLLMATRCEPTHP